MESTSMLVSPNSGWLSHSGMSAPITEAMWKSGRNCLGATVNGSTERG
jgi:hypothetical protein